MSFMITLSKSTLIRKLAALIMLLLLFTMLGESVTYNPVLFSKFNLQFTYEEGEDNVLTVVQGSERT